MPRPRPGSAPSPRGPPFASLGTSGVLFAANGGYRPNAASAVHTFCHAVPDTWHQMGVILSATDALNWYADIVGADAETLTAELGDTLRPPTKATFLPYLSGERTPYNDAAIRGVFAGLDRSDGRQALTQAILEGVAFALRDSLEALGAAGTRPQRVMAVGGGSKSPYWLSALATALGVPVDLPHDGDFGAAFGAARLGLIAANAADPRTVCTPPAIEHSFEPEPGLRDGFAEAYQRYRSLYPGCVRSDCMTTGFFEAIENISYEGPDSENPLAFRHYNPDEMIMGKRMEDHLRMAVCYWHSFVWPGGDPFGGQTFDRPWFPDRMADGMAAAKLKADVAFEMFEILNVPYYTFHDADVRPEGADFKENTANLNAIVDYFQEKQAETGVKLLWGTANLFSNRRYMAGAATNPDPDVFAFAAATVKTCIDATHRLGGENYVLWGGREGYETLLNTDLKREDQQLGRFLNLVVEYKHKIGFKGTILIEPKPQEPTKHQYDYDVATVYSFLRRHGLENEVKANIEQGHAILAGHSFEHEIALAQALGIFGSIDMNRNDYQSGWDTDQFPNNAPEVALAYYYILQGGGFSTGGTNFDAKLRRQSIDPADLLYGHIGGMDICARGLRAAAWMLQDNVLADHVEKRYAGWAAAEAQEMLSGSLSLGDIVTKVETANINPEPKSGRQEYLETIVNRYV